MKKRKFNDFKIHPYYHRDSYIKHGVELETIKDIFPQFEKIVSVFKRPAKIGYKYSFRYQLGEAKFLILCFYLDEYPPKFFNAYFDYTSGTRKNINILKKTRKWIEGEFNREH